jgi:beta-lactam-binding protein with PASTA domain
MSGRLTVLLPRLALVVVVLLLATTAATYAAQGGGTPAVPEATTAPAAPTELVVPDVRRQAYVFAKGILEEAGFAWKLQGGAPGFAANEVVSQNPAPGTALVDTGAPLITLSLARNAGYAEEGTPEASSPYAGTRVVLAGAAAVKKPAKKPAATKPAAKPVAPKPVTAKPVVAKPAAKKQQFPQHRPPAFAVPGAPSEPLDEMPLADRVRQLDAWLTRHPKVSAANVDHWLFQHNWIVTGARFGWWRGAEALRLLIRVDERAQQVWGVGSKSELLARRALAEVEARAG